MDTLWVESGSAEVMGPKWSKVLILSLVCHLAIFSTIFFIPGQMSGRGVRSVIYEVNLVEMPEEKQSKAEEGAISKAGKRLTGPKKAAPAKRVVRPKKKRKPVVIAKRTLPTKRQKVKKPEVSSSELIDRALSRIERKIKAEKKDPIDQAISKLEGQVKRAAAKGYTGGQADRGVSIRIYQIEVESRIKGN